MSEEIIGHDFSQLAAEEQLLGEACAFALTWVKNHQGSASEFTVPTPL